MQLLNYSYCLTVFDADFKMPVKMITVIMFGGDSLHCLCYVVLGHLECPPVSECRDS